MLKIAVCDDNEEHISALRKMLDEWSENKPFAVVIYEYQSAENFLFSYPDKPCDIILLDIEMKNLNGMELAKKLRKNGDMLPIIFITGYSDIKVYVYYQQFGSDFKAANKLLTDSNGNNYFTGYEEAVAALDKLETYMIKNNYWAYDFVEATQFMIDNCDEKIIAMYHITADDRVMGGINKAKKLTQTVRNSKYTTAEGEEIQRIYVSTLCPNDTEPFDTSSYAYELAKLSGGIAVTGYDANEDTEVMTAEAESVEVLSNDNTNNTSGTITKSLKQILGEGNEGVYKVISSAGLTTIKLNQPLTDGSDEDKDQDGLSDWDEVNTTLIYNMYAKYNHSYTPVINSSYLPTLADCNDYYQSSDSQKVYVESGYEIFINKNAGMYYQGDKEKAYAELSKLRILPICSDPTKPDSDGDGFWDCVDNNLPQTYVYEINDPQPLYRNKIDKYTIERLRALHPKAQKSFLEFILVGQVQLSDVTIRITDHYRTIEEQNELYAQGRTKPGTIVTWVKGGSSYHNYGLAMDIAFIDRNGKLLYDDKYYNILKSVYPDFNLEWGGEWQETPDKPHYQMTFNYSCSDLLKKYNNNEVDDNGYIIL